MSIRDEYRALRARAERMGVDPRAFDLACEAVVLGTSARPADWLRAARRHVAWLGAAQGYRRIRAKVCEARGWTAAAFDLEARGRLGWQVARRKGTTPTPGDWLNAAREVQAQPPSAWAQ